MSFRPGWFNKGYFKPIPVMGCYKRRKKADCWDFNGRTCVFLNYVSARHLRDWTFAMNFVFLPSVVKKWNLIKLRFMHAVITGRLAIQWHAGRTVVLTCLQFTTCVYQCVFIPIIWFVGDGFTRSNAIAASGCCLSIWSENHGLNPAVSYQKLPKGEFKLSTCMSEKRRRALNQYRIHR